MLEHRFGRIRFSFFTFLLVRVFFPPLPFSEHFFAWEGVGSVCLFNATVLVRHGIAASLLHTPVDCPNKCCSKNFCQACSSHTWPGRLPGAGLQRFGPLVSESCWQGGVAGPSSGRPGEWPTFLRESCHFDPHMVKKLVQISTCLL